MAVGTWSISGLTQLGHIAGGFQTIPRDAKKGLGHTVGTAAAGNGGWLQSMRSLGVVQQGWDIKLDGHARSLDEVGGKLVSTAGHIDKGDLDSTNAFHRVPQPGAVHGPR